MLTASTNCCFDFSISPEAVCATQGEARSANRTARAAAVMFVSATGPTCLSEDVVSAIDIDRFSSDQLGVIRRQDGGRDADDFRLRLRFFVLGLPDPSLGRLRLALRARRYPYARRPRRH